MPFIEIISRSLAIQSSLSYTHKLCNDQFRVRTPFPTKHIFKQIKRKKSKWKQEITTKDLANFAALKYTNSLQANMHTSLSSSVLWFCIPTHTHAFAYRQQKTPGALWFLMWYLSPLFGVDIFCVGVQIMVCCWMNKLVSREAYTLKFFFSLLVLRCNVMWCGENIYARKKMRAEISSRA